jgi:hypothetical protein
MLVFGLVLYLLARRPKRLAESRIEGTREPLK